MLNKGVCVVSTGFYMCHNYKECFRSCRDLHTVAHDEWRFEQRSELQLE